jgi:arylsulfatase A-like enzyme
VLPTLLACAGVQIPPHVQGRSLLPLLQGSTEPVKQSALTEHTGWKSLRTDRYRYVAHADGREFLYDLEACWGDYRNVADDSSYAAALATARHALVQRLIEMERPLPRVWPY